MLTHLHGEFPLRVQRADAEDSESEYDAEREQMHGRDWAKVATSSHLPAAHAAGPKEKNTRAAKRQRQRQRHKQQRRGAGTAPAAS